MVVVHYLELLYNDVSGADTSTIIGINTCSDISLFVVRPGKDDPQMGM